MRAYLEEQSEEQVRSPDDPNRREEHVLPRIAIHGHPGTSDAYQRFDAVAERRAFVLQRVWVWELTVVHAATPLSFASIEKWSSASHARLFHDECDEKGHAEAQERSDPVRPSPAIHDMSSVIQSGALLEEHDTYFALATKKPKKNGASTGEITNPMVHKLN